MPDGDLQTVKPPDERRQRSPFESCGLDTIDIHLNFIMAQTPVEVVKVIPSLLQSHQGRCPTQNTGPQLLNAVFCHSKQ